MADEQQMKRQWRGLAGFYREHPWRFAGAMLFSACSAFLSMMLPLVLKFVVDAVLDDQAPGLPIWLTRLFDQIGGREWMLDNLWLAGLIVLGIALVDGIFIFFYGKWIAVFAEHGARRIRKLLFGHIQDLPYAYHARAETGDLVQRCTSDVENINKFFGSQLLEIVRSLTLITFSVLVMVRLSSRMALISLAITPVIFVSAIFFFRRERDAFQKWDEAEGALSATLQENLTGIRVVKAFARQRYEHEKFNEKNKTLLKHGWKTYRILANFWMVSDFLCLFQIGAVTIVGTLLVIRGSLTLGQLLVFISYTEMLLYPLRGLARIIGDAGKTQISNSRIQEILGEPAEPEEAELANPELKGRITFDQVSFSYQAGSRLVLQDISFEVLPGETIGLIGPTGSGKSTLLHLLQRLYDPTRGCIMLDGLDTRQIQRSSIRRQIGLILQEPFVFSRSVFENIRLPRPAAVAEEVYGAARTAVFHDEVLSFEKGYETLVGERGVTLSGGQKQRLTIARTLIRDCPIVVFDDSMSAVDTETDREIREELAKRRRRATTLLVSHRISTLAGADRILVLENGRITDQGTHQQLISRPGLYQRVFDIQNSLDLQTGGDGS